MKLFLPLTAALALTACATGPEEYRYAGAGRPAVSADQGLKDCRVQADMLPVTQQALTNPMFVAASQQQFITNCMAAKGYR